MDQNNFLVLKSLSRGCQHGYHNLCSKQRKDMEDKYGKQVIFRKSALENVTILEINILVS